MATVVTASNILVSYPINDWLTWGAFTFPIAFLVADVVNRHFGPSRARTVAYAGFALAVALSLWLATPRIALASGGAFIIGQLADIAIFNHLRNLKCGKRRSPLRRSLRLQILRYFSALRSREPDCHGSPGASATTASNCL